MQRKNSYFFIYTAIFYLYPMEFFLNFLMPIMFSVTFNLELVIYLFPKIGHQNSKMMMIKCNWFFFFKKDTE